MVGASDMEQDTFQRKLARATELNTSAPWRESQALLDELEPHLDDATPDQRAQFVYLDARNMTLDDNLGRPRFPSTSQSLEPVKAVWLLIRLR